MKKKISFLNLLAVLFVLFTGVYQADAANLRARSLVISPATGYPNWYQDNNNLALTACLDLNPAFCFIDPTAQPFPADKANISPQNFPPEHFYYMADTAGVSPGGNISVILYEAALEAGFALPDPRADGKQAVFTRIRCRANVNQTGTYILTHPYGVETFVVTAIVPGPEINFTEDIPGLVAGAFDGALTSRVGPFLTNAAGTFVTDLATGNRYIGNFGVPVAFTGSPMVPPTNFVQITGPTADTFRSDTLSLMGKVIGLVITPPLVGGTDFGVAKLTPGVTKTFALTNLTANAFTPVIAANVPNIIPVTPSPDFTIVPAGCAAPLAPNATCNFDVIFAPLADGAKTATIVASGPDVPPAQTTVTGTGDGLAPTVTLDSLKFFTNSPLLQATITGTVADNGVAGVASVNVSVNGGAVQTVAVLPTGGAWSFTATGLIATDVIDNNSISVTATDLALPDGNTSTPPVTGTITVDSILPAVAITSPAPGLTNDNTPTLTFTATDTNLSTVIVKVDGVTANTASGAPLAQLADGLHTVQVEALDSAGNATVATVNFTVDALPPVQTLTSPAAGGFTNDNTPLLTFSTTDATAVTNVVRVDGAPVITAPGESLELLADGPHTLIVDSTDAAGNISTTTANFTVDTILPLVAITAPTAGLTNDNTPLLTFTATDTNAMTNVVKVDGIIVTTVSGGSLAPLADGQHTVMVESTDAAGNIGFAQVIISVDTVVSPFTLTPVATPTRVNKQAIGGTVEAGATVDVTIGNGTPAHAAVIDTAWRFDVAGLVEGVNSITVTATDPAGNSVSQLSSINIVFPNGDINGDAEVKIEDALKSLQFAAGLIQPTAVEALHADVAPLENGISKPNNKVDTGDVMLILRKSLGLVNWQINN